MTKAESDLGTANEKTNGLQAKVDELNAKLEESAETIKISRRLRELTQTLIRLKSLPLKLPTIMPV